jgi:hypothetical protein
VLDMPINWLAAAKIVPWMEILKQAPALVSAADRLLSRTQGKTDVAEAGSEMDVLRQRLAALEARDQENALLVKQLVDQVERLTEAFGILGARQRLLYWICGASVFVAVAAIALAATA